MNDYGAADLGWLSIVEHVFAHYKSRAPGSVLKKTEATLVWNWKDCSPSLWNYCLGNARNVQLHLDSVIRKWILDVHIDPVLQQVQVKSQEANMTNLINKLIKQIPLVKYVLCIGSKAISTEAIKAGGLRLSSSTNGASEIESGGNRLEVVSVIVGNMMAEGTVHVKDVNEMKDMLERLAEDNNDSEGEGKEESDGSSEELEVEEENVMRLAVGMRRFSL